MLTLHNINRVLGPKVKNKHTLGNGIHDLDTLIATARAAWVRTVAQRPTGFAHDDEYAVRVVTFGRAMSSNAWTTVRC
jgi:hypothetical protein